MKQRVPIFVLTVIAVFFGSCLKDDAIKQDYRGFAPAEINDGWQISTPEAENINRNRLEQAYELVYRDNRFVMARSLLVFRNGKLVAEAYPMDNRDITRFNNIQSCTKSVTSLLVGVALQQNLINSVHERFYDIYPDLFGNDLSKRAITISDALTMRSGIDFHNDRHTQKLYSTRSNSTRYVLSLGSRSAPGTAMHYNDGDPHLVSRAIEEKSGKNLAAFAREHVFDKIGITNWQWEQAGDNTTFGAFSLFLTARDFGRIGQLLLRNGAWEDEQLADPEYLQAAVTRQVTSSLNDKPYGYYFWLFPEWNAYAALGHGGQFLFVAPDKNLVVVYTAWPYTGSNLWDDAEELMSVIIGSCD